MSRARDVYPELARHGEVDVLISGIQADVDVPFPVKYKVYGMSFIFGKRGGVDIWETARRSRPWQLINDIRKFPVEQYDLVVNDFEPISAWACKGKGLPCVSLSHQCAVLHEKAPKPAESDFIGQLVLTRYAPVTAAYGFHFTAFAENIFTPVIRKEIRALRPSDNGHHTVYLPAYSDEAIIRHLSRFPAVKWQVFSKHNKQPITVGNIEIRKIDNAAFIESMATSTGVLCGGGFEGPAEAMYLNKKVLVVPMQTQYEQQCNAAGAALMGASVIPTLSEASYPVIDNWLSHGQRLIVDYPDITSDIVDKLMREQTQK